MGKRTPPVPSKRTPETRRYGYARVSTAEQTPELQVEALRAAGCDRVVVEEASGADRSRPRLARLLEQLRAGDELVVWKLDRLSRSLANLLSILARLEEDGVAFRSLTEAIDTASPAGRMMLAMLGAVAEFERAMIRERTTAGLAARRALGRVGGRTAKLSAEQRAQARQWLRQGRDAATVGRLLNVHRSTVLRSLEREDRSRAR